MNHPQTRVVARAGAVHLHHHENLSGNTQVIDVDGDCVVVIRPQATIDMHGNECELPPEVKAVDDFVVTKGLPESGQS